MFGYAAFAQPSYAALGGSYFVVTLSEDIAVADFESALRTQFATISEAITSAVEAEAVVASFVAFITEAMQVADINVGIATYTTSAVTEAVNISDINDVVATFRYSVTEQIMMDRDAYLVFYWVKINNSESTDWVLIDNRQ